MSKIGFATWLMQQSERDDPVGHLAADVASDSRRPHGNAGFPIWKNYLFTRGATSHALAALQTAWNEYLHTTFHAQMPE